MTLKELRKMSLQKGDEIILMGENVVRIKDVFDNGRWVHIISDDDFNYTHKDVVEVRKSIHEVL